MSETDRNAQIRLDVDQEVFIESVGQGHRVDDANVATEVTSFERVGDAYVLEGAILFAGYLVQVGTAQPPSGVGGPPSRHVHHRMPFTLRVPVEYQSRGVVNVASRISDWQLDVIGEGWVRVQAQLRVAGLNGKHGYHFQCGAQDEGDVLFGNTDNSERSKQARADEVGDRVPAAEQSRQDDGVEPLHESVTERDSADMVGQGYTRAAPVGDDPVSQATSELSQARGGAGSGEEIKPGEITESHDSTAHPTRTDGADSGFARDELLSLDKHVQPPTDSPGVNETEAAQQTSDGHREETTEFEFEHQVNLANTRPRTDARTNVGEDTPRTKQTVVDESFVASRSFSEDGFQATAGFVPTVKVGTSLAETAPEQDEITDAADVDERSLATVDTSMWSFVDFNGPENFFTLRYVIVMEEESLGSIADRVGCSETELLRTNRVTGEAVVPGQVLKIPVGLVPIKQ